MSRPSTVTVTGTSDGGTAVPDRPGERTAPGSTAGVVAARTLRARA